jgi:anti-sigma B factor antagonist
MKEPSGGPQAPVGMTDQRPAVQRMTVEVHSLLPNVTLVLVRGAIDKVSARDLERQLAVVFTALARAEPPRVMLDLAGVTYLDQTGLDMLLHLQDRVIVASGAIELVSPSPAVVRLLHEADLDGVSWMRSISEAPEDHQAP